jgi:diaminopimelate epimerase
MIPFTKMQGIGNDFVVIDALRDGEPKGDLAELSRAVNDRRFGIGGDGLILLERGREAPFKMRMFNPDGSESEMCGNGIRCFAKLIRDHGHSTDPVVDVETGAGTLRLEVTNDGQIRVDMGTAKLGRLDIGVAGAPDEQFIEQPVGEGLLGTAVSMGNPHLVIFTDDVKSVDLETVGPRLERHDLFPKRVNVHFVQVVDPGTLIQRTWERGAGITLACGTGACSVAVAGVLTGRTDRDVLIHLPGGDLRIEYRDDGRVFMTGPAETVFTGKFG